MDALTAPAPARRLGAVTSEPPHVLRPRRLWVALSVLVVLAGVLVAAAFAVLRGQPPDFAPNGACCTPPDGEPPHIGGPVTNDGRFTVRIAAVEGPPGTETLVVPAGVPGTIEAAEPFAPFDLEPGTFRDVFLRAETPGCTAAAVEEAGSRSGSSAVRIAYRQFGIDRSTVVDADEMGTLFVAETPDGSCAYLDPSGR